MESVFDGQSDKDMTGSKAKRSLTHLGELKWLHLAGELVDCKSGTRLQRVSGPKKIWRLDFDSAACRQSDRVSGEFWLNDVLNQSVIWRLI